ncbi:N-acetylmuramoyl-L-alanine amidase [Candidatus Photodesmus blepharus]|uniref:N-acetylmuramoyl-L-alanine amidase n=1 Tax=Candidatus Photodesmus blepharonis TaxID=1179155 RepID=A0A084CNR0_9GAMM|nr:N-acetylmuramoyl-L-alanine amidase [Candidatus Photodesmus blepharus]
MIVKRVRTFFLLTSVMFFFISLVRANVLEGIRVWPSPNETRVVIDLKLEADYKYFFLSNPERLVVDLKNTFLSTQLPRIILESSVLIKIRESLPPNKSTYRLVFELKGKIIPKIFKLPQTFGRRYGHRLVIDFPHHASNESHLKKLEDKTHIFRNLSQLSGFVNIVVAIDAGHGGEDSGSIGPTGKYEKHSTLLIAKKLAEQINSVSGMKAILTRSSDYFVSLNKRSEIARKNKAHLLVSIHADAFHSPQPRGGSVFVLNNKRANTEIARWIENHEQHSELLGGTGQVLSRKNTDKNVSQTLLDLQFSHSQRESYKVAKKILKEMEKIAYLHKKEPVNASLAVLKSPDIPSVLVETGFISNPKEEKLLFQHNYQNKLAYALKKAIVQYFKENPIESSLFSMQEQVRHKVHRGEFLGKIAKKYDVTVDSLRLVNKLRSDELAIGQVLLIPK